MSSNPDEWLVSGADVENTASNLGSRIFSSSFKSKFSISETLVSRSPDEAVDTWLGPTCDEDSLYVTTQNRYKVNSDGTHTLISTEGDLVCINRHTNTINWRVSISSLTGVEGDYSRSSPAIHGDYLFIASGIQAVQTYATPSEPNRKVYSLYTGVEQKPTSTPPSLMCLNKKTGALVWKSLVTDTAQYYDSPDNMTTITISPFIFRCREKTYGKSQGKSRDNNDFRDTGRDRSSPKGFNGNVSATKHNGNDKSQRPCHQMGYNPHIVGIGVSSTQSFLPAVQSVSPYTTFAPQPITATTIFETDYRVNTDVGAIVLFNTETGERLGEVRTGPPLYKAGDVLDDSKNVEDGGGFLVPGQNVFTIYRWLTADDVATLSSGVPLSYEGNQEVTFVLTNHFGLGTKTIPPVLNNQQVCDRTGAKVVLVGGSLITDNLEGVVLTLRTYVKAGTLYFSYDGQQYPYDDSFMGARMLKFMRNGDVLDTNDAYEMNYYGASVWASTAVIGDSGEYPESNSNALYIMTGQCHKMPAEDSIMARENSVSYIDICRIVRSTQDIYFSNPNPDTLAAWKAAVSLFDTEAEKLRKMKVSPRRKRFTYCSLVAIDLEYVLGMNGKGKSHKHSSSPILDSFTATGYDCWNLMFDSLSLRSLNPQGTVAYNSPQSPFKYQTLYTDIQMRMGSPMGPDGDFSAGPMLMKTSPGDFYLPNDRKTDRVLITATGKFGCAYTFDITDKSKIDVLHNVRLGFPGLLGGANIGSTLTRDLCGKYGLICTQSNGQKYNVWNLNIQTGIYGDRENLPMNQLPELTWLLDENSPYINSEVLETNTNVIPHAKASVTPKVLVSNTNVIPLPKGHSYNVRYNPLDGTIRWITPLSGATSICPVSSNKEVSAMVDGDGKLIIQNVQNGNVVYEQDVQHAGQTRPIFLKHEMYLMSGRNAYSTNVPQGEYSPSSYLYGYHFGPKC